MCDMLILVIPPTIWVLCAMKFTSKRINDPDFWNFMDSFPELKDVDKKILIGIFAFWALLFWIPMTALAMYRWAKNKWNNRE